MRSPRLLALAPFALAAALLTLDACDRIPRPAAKSATPGSAPAADTSDAALIAAQLPTYPLKECPISGEKLGSHGEPYDVIHEGRLVRFCCDGCLKDFKKDPAAVIAKIDAAAAAQTTAGS